MKPVVVNVSMAGCRPFPALMHDGRVLSLAACGSVELARVRDMAQLVEEWDRLGPLVRTAGDSPGALLAIQHRGIELEHCRVHAPISPRQVFCTIGNYRSQLIEAALDAGDGPEGAEAPARRRAVGEALRLRRAAGSPYVCVKPTSCVSNPFDELVLPIDASSLDWEVEIGVIIGRTAWQVAAAEALDHVAGYCVVNDITLRERVFREDPPKLGTDWLQSKGRPGWLPVGPWFVPSWSIERPQDLRPWLRLNGTVMQHGCANDMLFDIAEQISYLSRHTRLEPGDLLCSGSPAGFGSHHRRYLRDGDVVEAGVDELGVQRIRCVEKSTALHSIQ